MNHDAVSSGNGLAGHDAIVFPSEWVKRWAGHLPRKSKVLDVACGSGRHSRLLARLGHPVVAVDIDTDRIVAAGIHDIEIVQADLENGAWPFEPGQFGGVVVTNYLHRPLFNALCDALAPGGLLIYETFAAGNERFGRPANPAHLLQPGELLEVARGRLRVLGYEDVYVSKPKAACVQRICAIR